MAMMAATIAAMILTLLYGYEPCTHRALMYTWNGLSRTPVSNQIGSSRNRKLQRIEPRFRRRDALLVTADVSRRTVEAMRSSSSSRRATWKNLLGSRSP